MYSKITKMSIKYLFAKMIKSVILIEKSNTLLLFFDLNVHF